MPTRLRTRRCLRAGVLAVISLPIFCLILIAAYWLRFEGAVTDQVVQQLSMIVPWVVAVKLVVFTWFRVYQGWNRYATFYDLVVLAQASAASAFALVLMDYFLLPTILVPRSIFLLDFGGTIAMLGGLRAGWRCLHETRSLVKVRRPERVRALIVGANDTGEALLRAIRGNPNRSHQIVGFISSDLQSSSSRIAGIPILGDLTDLKRTAKQFDVSEFLLVADEFSGREVRQIMEVGNAVKADVKVLPSFEQLLDKRVDLRPRTVSIVDLLRRDPVQLDMRGMHRWIDGRVLMVTGASGSIGSEICRQLLQFEPQRLVLVDRSENGQFFLQRELKQAFPDADIQVHVADVGDRARMDQLLAEYHPDILFHAAAYKHVPLMEANPGEAVKNIVLATKTLADLADQHRVASFVMISTDKAVNPTSIMGACKRVAEIYVQALSKSSRCRYVTVRFGNVLDSAGSVVPIFRRQIAEGGPVTVTHPQMKRYFMMIPEASQLVIQAGAMGQGGEIFVLNMGEPVRIVDLAREMINLSGLQVGRDIEIEYTGMRPGEKLFEELHNDGENHVNTVHPKIMVASATDVCLDRVDRFVERLGRLTGMSSQAIVRELNEMVPLCRSKDETISVPYRKAG